MEVLGSVVNKTRLSYFQACVHKFNESILEGVVDDPFVFLHRDWASWVPL